MNDLTADEELLERYVAARRLLDGGDSIHARREFESLTFDAPGFSAAWDGLGGCWEAEGELKRAFESYRRAIRVDRRNWRSRYNLGLALQRSGDLHGAMRWFRDAIKIAPKQRCLYLELGRCFAERGDCRSAIRTFEAALRQPEDDISDAEILKQIARAHSANSDHAAAEAAFERSCLLQPSDPDLYYHWAVAAAAAANLDDAERLAVRAAALERGGHRAALLRVTLAIDSGDETTARVRIDELAARPGAGRLAAALRAELAYRLNRRQEAQQRAYEVLRQPGDPADAAVDRALTLLRELRGREERCQGYRLVLEVHTLEGCYFRPYMVLAASEDEAVECAAEVQEALDSCPWVVAEKHMFPHRERTLVGVYQVLLTRVLFPHSEATAPFEPTEATYTASHRTRG